MKIFKLKSISIDRFKIEYHYPSFSPLLLSEICLIFYQAILCFGTVCFFPKCFFFFIFYVMAEAQTIIHRQPFIGQKLDSFVTDVSYLGNNEYGKSIGTSCRFFHLQKSAFFGPCMYTAGALCWHKFVYNGIKDRLFLRSLNKFGFRLYWKKICGEVYIYKIERVNGYI